MTPQTPTPAPRDVPTVAEALHDVAAALVTVKDALVAAVAGPTAPHDAAEAVRDLAASYQDADPRFAEDLFAAADRHERLAA